ncbi:MAG: hypothetical protein Kow00108_26360 [Calditrichia bacterium]
MELREKIRKVLENHNLMHIATVDENGHPHVRGVDYAIGEKDDEIYFITHKMTRKVGQIKNNEKIAFVVDHDCPEWEDLQKLVYIKGIGTAQILETPEEIQKAFGLILQKFPYLKNLPGEPSDFVGVKVVLNEVYVTDNTVSFGHTETYQF